MASSVSRGPKLAKLLLCCFFIGVFIPFALASHHGSSGVSDDLKMESRAKSTQPKRVLCGYGIDLDAVSLWANTGDGTSANPSDISRGIYGATVGVDRLLSFLDRHHIKATCGLHGYTHEHMSALNASQEEEILSISLDSAEQVSWEKAQRLDCTSMDSLATHRTIT
ncbi:unnamed protein product [Penicillium olsonii]|nr:unnamed protein product [Penicillium olsonii]